MYLYAFGEKTFCMFNANKVFVLHCIVFHFIQILLYHVPFCKQTAETLTRRTVLQRPIW